MTVHERCTTSAAKPLQALLLLTLLLPSALLASDFFTIWPDHPAAPGRLGPPESAVEQEWDVRLNMRGIAANSAAVARITVLFADDERTFVMRRFSDIKGFELLGEDDFQISPDARDEDISYNWYGEADGEQMTIAVYEGVMSATITGDKGVYSLIRQHGEPLFQKIDVTRIPNLEPIEQGDPEERGKQWSTPLAADAPTPKFGINTVDVLVVHTPAALAFAGSLPDLNSRVAESFLQIQEAMTVSGMDGVRVRNVLSGSNLSTQVAYNEVPGHSCSPGTNANLCRWVGHRIWLRTSGTVASLRNTHGADLVVMLVADQTGAAGVAYVQGANCGLLEEYENTPGCGVGAAYEAFAFSVISTTYTTSFQVFAHEVGHQFGMQHQMEIASPTPAYPWSHAKTRSNGVVQTVVGGYGFARSLQYSNPNVPFSGTGEASGATLQFNARTGSCLAAAMSGFRTPGQLFTMYSDGFELRLIPIDGC